jgi:hypothetical protein
MFADTWTAEKYFGNFRQNFGAFDAADLSYIAKHLADR